MLLRNTLSANGDVFESAAVAPDQRCEACGASMAGRAMYARYRVCDECGHHEQIGVRLRISSLVDSGSFHEFDRWLESADPLNFSDSVQSYAVRLEELQAESGESDAIVTGDASLHGHPIVLAVVDFGFLGGSMGVVVGEKVARAAERAVQENKALITVVASGGARMQEGLFSLLQMAKTAAAIQRLHRAGVPYISILTHPTTGGVLASFASLGDLIVAEPEALVGFAGPRVAEQMLGSPLPPGTHRSEFLMAHGLIDRVLPRPQLRSFVGSVLDVLATSSATPDAPRDDSWRESDPAVSAWERVEAARHPDRPTTLDYLDRMLGQFVEIHGDRRGHDDPAVIAGFGLLAGRKIAVVGFERGHGDQREQRRGGRPMPEGYRKAQRLLALAARFNLPVLTLIDTPGAYPGIEAEEHGQAMAIAETLALLSHLPVPIVAVIIGEGGSGGALALAAADRVLIQERAVYSVIAPEGAAAILYRDASRAAEIAEKLRVTASDVVRAGFADAIVPEPTGGAVADPDAAAAILSDWLISAFDELAEIKNPKLLQARQERYRAVGSDFVKVPRDRRTQTGRSPVSRRNRNQAR